MDDVRGDRIAFLYNAARGRAWRTQAWSLVTGRPWRPLSLAEVRAACTITDRHDAGLQTVAIGSVKGTAAPGDDFDRDFDPRRDRSRHRWRRVAQARFEGRELPPVVLVQVGDKYFVRDGRYRVSVARAWGQRDIEAQVTIWKVAGRLPWESAAAGREPASGALYNKVKGLSAELGRQLVLRVRGLVGARGA